jgi:GntR family transcriptional regulator
MNPITIDADAAVPVYEQLRSQIAGAIAEGRLADGERLPAARTLAADVGIAINTVGRAYSELESAGLVVSKRRTGTVVTSAAHDAMPTDVLAAAQRFALRAHAAKISAEQAVDLVRSAMYARATARPDDPAPPRNSDHRSRTH